MDWIKHLLFLFCYYQLTTGDEPPCVLELQCAECVPDNLPLVTSHRAANGSVLLPAGDEVTLSCGVGRFIAYPARSVLPARCEAGRFRVTVDGALRHLLELGCQENIFEDVLHAVEHCAPPLQGRAYQAREAAGTRHLATLCYDEDRATARFARVNGAAGNALRLPPHDDARAPLTLFGNFNHMFDAATRHAAERLYSDDVRSNRRLRELLKHDGVTFAEQTLTAARLLSPHYFEDQNARVAQFVSNAVPAWRSVAGGNLAHLQRDVARLLRASRPLGVVEVYAGTHGVASLRAERGARELYLGVERFPVPRYVWTVVVAGEGAARRALAVAVLNDPFVAVSEVREAVFCESACGRVAWLRELRRRRNYETPLYGLAFCCDAHNFTQTVREMPAAPLADVPRGPDGLLDDLFT